MSLSKDFFLSQIESIGEPIKENDRVRIERVHTELDGIGEAFLKVYYGRDLRYTFNYLQHLTYNCWPRVYDVRYFDGDTYVLEEILYGKTLRDMLVKRNKPYTCSFVALFGIKMCMILSHLHELNPPIVHRDLKPENIMFVGGKLADMRIIDFETSRAVKDESEHDTHYMVSEGYSAPEQFGIGQTDGRSDIFSLGVIMHELLTGKLLDESWEIDPSIRDRSKELARVIEKCVDVKKKNRYANVNELSAELRMVYSLDNESICETEQKSDNENGALITKLDDSADDEKPDDNSLQEKLKELSVELTYLDMMKTPDPYSFMPLIVGLLSSMLAYSYTKGEIIVAAFSFSIVYLALEKRRPEYRLAIFVKYVGDFVFVASSFVLLFTNCDAILTLPWWFWIIGIVGCVISGFGINFMVEGSIRDEANNPIVDMVCRSLTVIYGLLLSLIVMKICMLVGFSNLITKGAPCLLFGMMIFAQMIPAERNIRSESIKWRYNV